MATLPPVLVRSVYLHNPATATRNALWYGVNHDYEMLHCVLRYCQDFTSLVCIMGISVLSNYEKIGKTTSLDRGNALGGSIVLTPNSNKSFYGTT